MLDPWIIEEIRRREEERRKQERAPAVIEMPIHGPRPTEGEQGQSGERDETPRGVAIIDFSV